MPGGTIRIGRLAGIPIGINPLWLAIVALITAVLGGSYYPDHVDGIAPPAAYALGLASALLLFASILAHELGHALVARRVGVEIEEIDLWLLGGVARMRGQPLHPLDELRFAIAGPAVTLVIAGVFGALALIVPQGSLPALHALIEYQALVNAVILVFNMAPAFPLDGGRVFRSLIWWRTGDEARATRIAASVGRAIGFVLVGLGAISALNGTPGGLWLALIGLFVVIAASAERQHTEVRELFDETPAGSLVRGRAVVIPGRVTIDEAVQRYFIPYGYTAFPVGQNGDVVGLVSVGDVSETQLTQRGTLTVAEIANRDRELFIGRDDDVAELLDRPAFQRLGRAIVTGPDGYVGVVSITDVQRTIRARRLEAQPLSA